MGRRHRRMPAVRQFLPMGGGGLVVSPNGGDAPAAYIWEMLPIVDKPLIQYAVDEALSAGADTLVFITGSSKRAIEDHFDSNPELEAVLQAQRTLIEFERSVDIAGE